jgi:hypothetical protein
MKRAYVVIAFAAMMAVAIVSISHAGASCCDPGAAAAGPQGIRAAAPGPVPAPKPTVNPRAFKANQTGAPVLTGYQPAQPVPLTSFAPGATCCPTPNAAATPRRNALAPQPQGPATGCSGACGCGRPATTKPAQIVGGFNPAPIGAARPVPQMVAPAQAPRTAFTATPMKTTGKTKTMVNRTLW